MKFNVKKKTMDQKIAVLGAGSWGTAMAIHLGRIGNEVHLWARNKSLIETLLRDRMNGAYLPEILFPPPSSQCEAQRLIHIFEVR